MTATVMPMGAALTLMTRTVMIMPIRMVVLVFLHLVATLVTFSLLFVFLDFYR
jgi:hypothetical protein